MKYVIDIPDDIDFVEFYKSKNNKFLENRDIVSISTLEKYEDMTDAAVEVFASEADNREQRRAKKKEREEKKKKDE